MSAPKRIALFGFILSIASASCSSPEEHRLDSLLGTWAVECKFLVVSPGVKSLLSRGSVSIERAKGGGLWFEAPKCGQDMATVDIFLKYDSARGKYLLYPNTSSTDAFLRGIADTDGKMALAYSDEEGFTDRGDVREVTIKVGPDRKHVWSFSTRAEGGVRMLTWEFAAGKH